MRLRNILALTALAAFAALSPSAPARPLVDATPKLEKLDTPRATEQAPAIVHYAVNASEAAVIAAASLNLRSESVARLAGAFDATKATPGRVRHGPAPSTALDPGRQLTYTDNDRVLDARNYDAGLRHDRLDRLL